MSEYIERVRCSLDVITMTISDPAQLPVFVSTLVYVLLGWAEC